MIVILIVVAIGGFYLRGDNTDTTPEDGTANEQELVPATGNIDDTVGALLKETEAVIASDELASDILGEDTGSLDEFDQLFEDINF